MARVRFKHAGVERKIVALRELQARLYGDVEVNELLVATHVPVELVVHVVRRHRRQLPPHVGLHKFHGQ